MSKPKNRVADNSAPAAAPANGSGSLDVRTFAALASLFSTRAGIAGHLGQSYSGDRDIYTALGYTKNPSFGDFMARYRRHDIAKAVIDVPVRACWRKVPVLSESEDDETQFEQAWTDLVKRINPFGYFSRLDRLAAIGEYAVLMIGFNDAAQLWQPVKKASEVLYLMPYSQENATIESCVQDAKDPRFGQPESYSIKVRTGTAATATRTIKVHWSRVIHVSEDNLDDDTFGIPRLEAVLNRLQDLELVSGGSAEMFWRGAFPGMGFKLDEDFDMTEPKRTLAIEEIERYMHGLQRYIKLKGMSIENIAQQVSDPSGHADLFIALICAACRIPKRILLGNEQGELASTQDESNWFARVDERRREHCEPNIVRAFVDRLIGMQVLPTPADGYTCEWEDLLTPSARDKAEVADLRSRAMAQYFTSGSDASMPFAFFCEHELGYSRDLIEKMESMAAEVNELANGDGNPNPDNDDQLPDGDPGSPIPAEGAGNEE